MPRGGWNQSEELIDYLARYGARTDDVLDRVRRETAAMPMAQMQVSADQGALLELLVKLIGANSALEVGTFTGYSAICIARGLPEGGKLICLELDEERAAIARRNLEDAGVSDRVEILIGPAGESLEAMSSTPQFDFAFIDADKASYEAYFEAVLPMLSPRGLLAADNVLWRTTVLDPTDEDARALAAFNDRVVGDPRVECVMLTVRDGITLVRRRAET